MSQFNSQNVWQRVHAAPEPGTDCATQLLALLPELGRCAALCRGHRTLAPSFQRQAAALAGICALLGTPSRAVEDRPSTASRPSPRADPPRPASASRSSPRSLSPADLRLCYVAQCRALSQYQALTGHREFGPGFAALIPLAQDTCLTLLALLGS